MMRLLRLAGGMVLGPALLVAAAVAQTPPKPVRVQYIQRQSRQAEQVALQSLRHAAIVKRVSIWDSWVRIDNLREHTAVVYKPDIHRYLLIDEAHKLYRVIDGAPPPPVEAPQATCSMQFHATPLGPATVGGAPAHGYRTTSAMQLPGMAMTHHGSIYFWDTPVPASVLAMATGYRPCAATTPVGRALPTDRLVLYRSIGGGKLTLPDSQQRPQPTLQVPRIELVNMRGHLRALTDTDRALFEPPAGYRQVVGQGDTGAAGGG